jgi:hypothetical protein
MDEQPDKPGYKSFKMHMVRKIGNRFISSYNSQGAFIMIMKWFKFFSPLYGS